MYSISAVFRQMLCHNEVFSAIGLLVLAAGPHVRCTVCTQLLYLLARAVQCTVHRGSLIGFTVMHWTSARVPPLSLESIWYCSASSVIINHSVSLTQTSTSQFFLDMTWLINRLLYSCCWTKNLQIIHRNIESTGQ